MMNNPKGQKRQLEKARQEKAAMKREKRLTRGADDVDNTDDESVEGSTFNEADLLAEIAELHRRFADEQVSLDDFEATRDELMKRLRVD